MSRPTAREEGIGTLQCYLENGNILVGGGAGVGLSAISLEEGGADLITRLQLGPLTPEELRFYGIQKFPKVGLIDGKFHRNLGETGMGYYQEIEIIKTAHELGLVTTLDVFSVDEAERMTRAGADVP
ncbi:MAG: hypothetical protein Q9197_000651 [Variospora fuerteventurae]